MGDGDKYEVRGREKDLSKETKGRVVGEKAGKTE